MLDTKVDGREVSRAHDDCNRGALVFDDVDACAAGVFVEVEDVAAAVDDELFGPGKALVGFQGAPFEFCAVPRCGMPARPSETSPSAQ